MLYTCLSFAHRFMVILQTREALNQAFIKQSNIFASRPQFYVSGLINPKRAGKCQGKRCELYDVFDPME